MLGGGLNEIQEAIEHGMLPVSMVNFRQKHLVVFDSETLEQDMNLNTNMEVEGVLKIVSIGCASTLPIPSRYFERKSSAPADSTVLIKEFLDHLFDLEKLYIQTVPEAIVDAVPDEDDEFAEHCGVTKQIERNLRKYLTMPIYGYNSGKLK